MPPASVRAYQERPVPVSMISARPTISFGWYVMAASFVIMSLNAGARLVIGVLFKPVIADFGWSRRPANPGSPARPQAPAWSRARGVCEGHKETAQGSHNATAGAADHERL